MVAISISAVTFRVRASSTSTGTSPRRREREADIRSPIRRSSRARPDRQASVTASSSSPTATWAAPSALWWLLRHFGRRRLCRHRARRLARPAHDGGRGDRACDFTLRPRDDDTIEAGELERRRGDLVVVDARLAPRWRGEPNPIDKVPVEFRARSTHRGTTRLRSYRMASSSPIAAPGSRRPSSFIACTSPDARASSTPAHGASGSSWACRSSAARRSTLQRYRSARGTAASRSGSSVRPGG